MIAVDTNLLVYSQRQESKFFESASACLRQLAEGDTDWAIPWPCIHEFLGVVTHPRILKPPTPLKLALEQVESWMESPNLMVLSETSGYWEHLHEIVIAGNVSGARIHDARIAALCSFHGVDELWSADRDFSRFPRLKFRNPLIQ